MSDDRRRRPATARSLQLGDVTISYVPDGAVQLVAHAWFPGAPAAAWAEHAAWLDDTGHLSAGIGGLLIQRGGRALLIDTGFGPQRIPASSTIPPLGDLWGGGLPESLRALGVTPGDIDTVAITHLHEDHTGWAWRGDFFPQARFVATATEWGANRRARGAVAADGDEIFPGVGLMELPGHTAGHAGYLLTVGEQRLLAFGDALHSPLQIAQPDWGAASDARPELALKSRERVLSELRVPGTIGYGNHFADVVFGRVTEAPGQDPQWEPVA